MPRGGGWPPVGYSQIPIGWGVLGVYRQTNDRALVERGLPLLVAFDEWYSRERTWTATALCLRVVRGKRP